MPWFPGNVLTFWAPLVGANEVVDDLTFAPKRCARKLQIENLRLRPGNQMAWMMRARGPAMARPIRWASRKRKTQAGAGKAGVRISNKRVERETEGLKV